MRIETIGDCTLYLGDCLEIMPTLGKVDAVVTDPPYNEVNRKSNGLRILDKGGADSAPVNVVSLAQMLCDISLGSIYVFCGTEQVSDYRRVFVKMGMSTRQGVWWKTNPPVLNGKNLWLSAVELCIYAKHPKATFNKNCVSPVWHGSLASKTEHPTEKPLWIIKDMIMASSNKIDIIFDPFMGSGTTGVACVELGRKFIGIEIDEKYFDIACERISRAERQGDLFRPKHTQESLEI